MNKPKNLHGVVFDKSTELFYKRISRELEAKASFSIEWQVKQNLKDEISVKLYENLYKDSNDELYLLFYKTL